MTLRDYFSSIEKAIEFCEKHHLSRDRIVAGGSLLFIPRDFKICLGSTFNDDSTSLAANCPRMLYLVQWRDARLEPPGGRVEAEDFEDGALRLCGSPYAHAASREFNEEVGTTNFCFNQARDYLFSCAFSYNPPFVAHTYLKVTRSRDEFEKILRQRTARPCTQTYVNEVFAVVGLPLFYTTNEAKPQGLPKFLGFHGGAFSPYHDHWVREHLLLSLVIQRCLTLKQVEQILRLARKWKPFQAQSLLKHHQRTSQSTTISHEKERMTSSAKSAPQKRRSRRRRPDLARQMPHLKRNSSLAPCHCCDDSGVQNLSQFLALPGVLELLPLVEVQFARKYMLSSKERVMNRATSQLQDLTSQLAHLEMDAAASSTQVGACATFLSARHDHTGQDIALRIPSLAPRLVHQQQLYTPSPVFHQPVLRRSQVSPRVLDFEYEQASSSSVAGRSRRHFPSCKSVTTPTVDSCVKEAYHSRSIDNNNIAHMQRWQKQFGGRGKTVKVGGKTVGAEIRMGRQNQPVLACGSTQKLRDQDLPRMSQAKSVRRYRTRYVSKTFPSAHLYCL